MANTVCPDNHEVDYLGEIEINRTRVRVAALGETSTGWCEEQLIIPPYMLTHRHSGGEENRPGVTRVRKDFVPRLLLAHLNTRIIAR